MGVLLPEGVHFDLLIEHSIGGDAGPFTGGGDKMVWHTGELDWRQVDVLVRVLHDKGAEPHFAIGRREGEPRIVVVQMVPLDQAGRTLRHTFTPETNRANAIQVEIAGRAAESGEWPVNRYQAFANLTRLVNIALPDEHEIPRRLARRFANMDRFGPGEFVGVEGHCGHQHVPGNDHVDPGENFRGQLLMDLLETMPDGGYPL